MASAESDPTCVNGGCLVGMKGFLPSDPKTYYSVPGQIVGCNRIQCRACGAWVRHFDNCRLSAISVDFTTYPKLYEASDPFQFDFISRDEGRVYTCRCNFADSPFGRLLRSLDTQWFCAGHPQTG